MKHVVETDVQNLSEFLERWDPVADLASWKRGEEAGLSLIDSQVRYEDTILPDHVGETYHGHKGLVRATERWFEPYGSLDVELLRIVVAAERVVSLHRFRMKARHTGIELDGDLIYVWTFEGGKVTHLKSYGEEDKAFDFAGVSEELRTADRFLTALGEHDYDIAARELHPELEIDDRDIPESTGSDSFRIWLARWDESWDDWRAEQAVLEAAAADRVLSRFRMVARGKGSGIDVARDDAVLLGFRSAKIARIGYYSDQAQALADAYGP